MNFIDNLISFFWPKRGAERMAYRVAMEEYSRNYDAGDASRLNANWRVGNSSAEVTDRDYRDIVRARARDLERNSDIMNSVVRPFRRNVIGHGFMLQAKTEDVELNRQLEKLWNEWCKARNCDVTATQTLTQMLRMAVQRKKIDGGILFKKCYTSEGMIPFQLQALEVDELDISTPMPRHKGNKVAGGIEFNSYNRPVGFFVRQYTTDGIELMTESQYVPAKDMIFIYSKMRPSQLREMSEVAAVAERVRDTNEFMSAVSVKERIMACLSVFIKKQLPESGGIGRTVTSQGGKVRDYQGKTLAPGMIRELNAGDEVQVVNPTGQSADATSFIKLNQGLVGAGMGLSYEATSRDMSRTTYSSARQGLIEDDETYIEDEEYVTNFLNEVYETFVISCVLSGKVSIKDFWEKKGDYFEHAWVKAPRQWIDPYKEANANKVALESHQKTFKQISAENGQDWKKVIDDMAEVNEYATSKGVSLEISKGGASINEQKEESETETAPGSES